ncbi:MAG: DNA translocase FtsK 4TM domain-containing protein [Gemmatimonadota bacterium]|nr:DNA translocase FtsK 4TM domain-containing protein [Gemmatimonadota bacterium]
MGSTYLRRELAGIAMMLFAVFLAGALAVLALAELRSGVDVRGSVGWVGWYLARPLVMLVGWPAAALAPLAATAYALRVFGRLGPAADGATRGASSWMVFFAGLALLLPVAVGLALGLRIGSDHSPAAGLWGGLVAAYWREWFGAMGAWVVITLALSALTAVTLAWNPIRMIIGRRAVPQDGVTEPTDAAPPRRRQRKPGASSTDSGALALMLEPAPDEMPAADPTLVSNGRTGVRDGEVGAGARRGKKKAKADAVAEREEEITAAIEAAGGTPDVLGDELPPSDLLTPPPTRNADAGRRELDAMGVKLVDALRTFRVEGELVGRTTGPVVTQYEIEPAPGVKVRQFATLANDLALAMRAPSIRVVAPIPGRGAVGVEVPNPNAEIVAFRELIETRDFQGARAALPIALGKDLEGKPVIADLAKMPHLLIAGATGSGKSVCVNTIITSLVYRHTPRTLRFLMVDPKMVELSVYNTLPHLRHKVITDNRDAAAVLKWAVMEMQERYELLAANGCRNIQDFNRRLQDGGQLQTPKRPDVAFEDRVYRGGLLPYIVVVIDEMADLMMTVQGEVETPIAMLAQKARAIGIHLLLATQRPSVNVITGLIKANFPSRIAFRVASQIDSRTIIDGAGAEALLGNGDMLFIPPGKSEPARLQGAFLSSDDTERLMKWYVDRAAERRAALSAQGLIPEEATPSEPDILETVRQREAQAAGGADGESTDDAERDKLFREAAEVVVQHQQGSTSLLQRRLKVGYGRAARIIDQLHTAGVLGPPDGSKPRDVLVGLDDIERICGPRN